jgi:hypothetical protein
MRVIPPVLWRHNQNNIVEVIPFLLLLRHCIPCTIYLHDLFQDWGDTFLFCTDGILNLQNGESEKFTQQNLIELLERIQASTKNATSMDEKLSLWTNQKLQKDDMTLIWFTLKGQENPQIAYYPLQEPPPFSRSVSTRGVLYAIQQNTCYLKITVTGNMERGLQFI